MTASDSEYDKEFLAAVREGEADLAAGRIYSLDEVVSAMLVSRVNTAQGKYEEILDRLRKSSHGTHWQDRREALAALIGDLDGDLGEADPNAVARAKAALDPGRRADGPYRDAD